MNEYLWVGFVFYSENTTYGKTPTKPIYKTLINVYFQHGGNFAPKDRDNKHEYRQGPIGDEQQPLMTVFVVQHCSSFVSVSDTLWAAVMLVSLGESENL